MNSFTPTHQTIYRADNYDNGIHILTVLRPRWLALPGAMIMPGQIAEGVLMTSAKLIEKFQATGYINGPTPGNVNPVQSVEYLYDAPLFAIGSPNWSISTESAWRWVEELPTCWYVTPTEAPVQLVNFPYHLTSEVPHTLIDYLVQAGELVACVNLPNVYLTYHHPGFNPFWRSEE